LILIWAVFSGVLLGVLLRLSQPFTKPLAQKVANEFKANLKLLGSLKTLPDDSAREQVIKKAGLSMLKASCLILAALFALAAVLAWPLFITPFTTLDWALQSCIGLLVWWLLLAFTPKKPC
jgi:hypothetical protein